MTTSAARSVPRRSRGDVPRRPSGNGIGRPASGRDAAAEGFPDCRVQLDAMPPLPSAVEAACFRIVQEALTNAERHASARELHVRLTAGLGTIGLTVTDDGKGFDVVIAHDQPAV